VNDIRIAGGWSWVLITQAYLWGEKGYTARVRLIQREDSSGELVDLDATHAIKGPRIGDERFESEVQLPDMDVAKSIIALCQNVVRKRRYQVIDGEAWDVDEFLDDNEGLIIAELEGNDARTVRRPEWAVREVTTDERYNNDSLAFVPYSRWKPRQDDGGDSIWA
jgi:adenylate cyclase